jgi:5-formyltetrahydrofolate cyclo-ligase
MTAEPADPSGTQQRMSDAPASPSKADLRAAALAARDALNGELRAAAAQAVARRGLPVEIGPGAVVAGYSPIRSELDPGALMQALAAQGARLALPAIAPRGQSLKFRIWSTQDRLVQGPLGILEPSPDITTARWRNCASRGPLPRSASPFRHSWSKPCRR